MSIRRRAVLHIGPPKTGTTSIQNFLANSRDELRDRGFHFAAAPGDINHLALAAFGAGEGFTGSAVRRAGGGGGDGASIGPRLARAIGDEVAALPEQVHTVVYSSEQLSTLVSTAADVARLRALLDPFFHDFLIVVYLRRQDEVAVSKYSTALRAGGETEASILPGPNRDMLLYRLADIVGNWATVFGQPAMRPRVLERGMLIGGDVISDFLAVVGIAGLDVQIEAPTNNAALSAETQELVRRFNALVELKELPDRPRLGPHLRDARFQGKPRLPTRAEALEFYNRFREGNERIRAAYFPGRERLFSEDFSRYPDSEEHGPATIPDAVAVLDVALEVLLLITDALRKAEVELMARDARDATAAGRKDKARQRWTRVLHMANGHDEALKAIAELDLAS